MALIVEDGTGKSDADSYVSLADYKTYCAAHGYDLGAAVDADLENDLRRAMQYLDGEFRYRDIRGSADQAGQFPRSDGAVDYDGLTIPPVPQRVKNAQCELALAGFGGVDLLPNVSVENGGRLKSKTIGPISKTWMDGQPQGPAYLKVNGFLRPYLRLDPLPPIPVNMGPTDAPFFATDLHDSKDGTAPGATEQEITPFASG